MDVFCFQKITDIYGPSETTVGGKNTVVLNMFEDLVGASVYADAATAKDLFSKSESVIFPGQNRNNTVIKII